MSPRCSPAAPPESAGLKSGDTITAVNGAPVYSFLAVYNAFKDKPDAAVKLTVKSGAATVEKTITGRAPTKPDKIPDDYKGLSVSGVQFGITDASAADKLIYPAPQHQIKMAATMMAHTFGAVFSRRGDVGIQQMGGPVKIGTVYFHLFTMPAGWRQVLWFSVILNVNLALMNLIPFPVFDGGHILMGIGEVIRRKPLIPWIVMEKVQMVCVAMLLCFFVYVTWFDTFDLFGNGKKSVAEPDIKIEDIQYAPAK